MIGRLLGKEAVNQIIDCVGGRLGHDINGRSATISR
jgi:hypothetical protein